MVDKLGISLETFKKLGLEDDDPDDIFHIHSREGTGAFGAVFKASYKHDPKRIVAIKVIQLALQEGQDGEEIDNVRREIQFLRECDHPNVTQFFEAYYKDGSLWIVMEYCGGGSVGDLVRKKKFSEENISVILREALKGLAYLHARKKIHRDIKGGNILLTTEGCVKIADFGVSAQLKDTISRRGTFVGTPYWMSPEMIQDSEYDCKADIWSLGITALELAEQKPPLFDEHPMRVLLQIPRKPAPKLRAPKRWSADFSAFIQFCLSKDPKIRPSALDCLKHPFIVGRKHLVNVSLPHLTTQGDSEAQSPRHAEESVQNESLVEYEVTSDDHHSDEDVGVVYPEDSLLKEDVLSAAVATMKIARKDDHAHGLLVENEAVSKKCTNNMRMINIEEASIKTSSSRRSAATIDNLDDSLRLSPCNSMDQKSSHEEKGQSICGFDNVEFFKTKTPPIVAPSMFEMLGQTLIKYGGLSCDNIFGIRSDEFLIREAMLSLEQGRFKDFEFKDAHLCSNLIITCLQKMPTSLLSELGPVALSSLQELKHQFGKSEEEYDSGEEKLLEILSLISQEHRVILDWLLDLLTEIIRHKAHNGMTIERLATAIAPCLSAGSIVARSEGTTNVGQVSAVMRTLLMWKIQKYQYYPKNLPLFRYSMSEDVSDLPYQAKKHAAALEHRKRCVSSCASLIQRNVSGFFSHIGEIIDDFAIENNDWVRRKFEIFARLVVAPLESSMNVLEKEWYTKYIAKTEYLKPLKMEAIEAVPLSLICALRWIKASFNIIAFEEMMKEHRFAAVCLAKVKTKYERACFISHEVPNGIASSILSPLLCDTIWQATPSPKPMSTCDDDEVSPVGNNLSVKSLIDEGYQRLQARLGIETGRTNFIDISLQVAKDSTLGNVLCGIAINDEELQNIDTRIEQKRLLEVLLL